MSSRRPLLFAVLLLVALLPERGWAQAGWQRFSPPDRSFSVLIPGTPEPPKVEKETGVTSLVWVLRTAAGGYVFSYGDYSSIPDAGVELQASMRNFLKAMKAKATTQRRISFKAPRGAMLPAIEFTYAAANARGAGKIVVDGNRAYMWIILVRAGNDGSADTARYLNSIAIIAPARQ